MPDAFAPARLIEYKTTKPGPRYGLMLLVGPLQAEFDARRLSGTGYTWQGVVESLVRMRCPQIEPELQYDPEADMFVVRSSDRGALESVAALIQAVIADPALLDQAIAKA